jgi:hypothetical protein
LTLGIVQGGGVLAKPTSDRRQATFANPLDLPYRYQPIRVPGPDKRPFREAADPTVVLFKGRYWLFASHSSGYWWSTDLLHWNFVEQQGAGVEKYAPTAVVIGDRLYMATSDLSSKIWVTDDPMSGKWEAAATIPTRYWDPALFLDDDGRLYMYYGLSEKNPLLVEELDPRTFASITPPTPIPASRGVETRGWEVVGDRNELHEKPSYIEGAWMTKHGGRYYLEYSAPGTEWKGYANGILTADRPMGPFTYQSYSPFAIKPTGFVAGAGHGSTFQGPQGKWWHIGTTTISQRHIFERRLALFPARFTASGQLVTDTYLADYPRYIDGNRELTGWMLLSRRKPVTVSSELAERPAANAVDEEIRTWWSAKSGNPGEWLQIDLGKKKRIEAFQVNFADQDSQGNGISVGAYRYRLELSDDGRTWRTAIDASATGRDAPHDYRVLPRAERARFVRLTNDHSPDGSKFSLYELRVFGNGGGPVPALPKAVSASRDPADPRQATVRWSPSRLAEFYVVRLGPAPDMLTQSFQVYDGATSTRIATLNASQPYYVAVDAVNEAGIRRSGKPILMR